MNDLSNYFSNLDRIEALEGEIIYLKEKLRLQSKKTAHYKAKWRMAISEHELPTDKARRLIKNTSKDNLEYGGITRVCKHIAKEVGLNFKTVRNLWYLNKEKQ